MPLNGEHPPTVVSRFGALDYSICRARRDAKLVRDPGERLMMEGICRQAIAAEGVREPRLRLDDHFVDARVTTASRIVIDRVRALARDVLHERPAKRDIHDLDAATNGERR